MKKIFQILIMTLIFFLLMANKQVVNESVLHACNLFIKSIFPSLFPILVFSNIYIYLNLAEYLNYIFFKINKVLFKVDKYSSILFLMSIISGNPSNAKIALHFYDEGNLSSTNINKTLLFSNFCNPLFIYTFTKNKFFLVFICHYIGNFIIGFFLRNKYIDKITNGFTRNKSKKIIIECIFDSINSAVYTLLFILGTIVTFYILINIFNISFLSPIIELSQGMNYINNLNISLKLKTILFSGTLSFGGLCIHMQIFGILNKLKIKYYPYLLSRICHALITMALVTILY